MADLSEYHPLSRFTGLADGYAKYRPSYPAPALDFILAHCGLGRESLLVDVGCGTGIAARLFMGRGVAVIGIEPNEEMRAKAETEPALPGYPAIVYRPGRAEATNLASGVADAVVAAQAFHWFEPAGALREFHRILKPNGWAVLLWNERDESDPFTADYGKVIRSTPEGPRVEQEYGQVGGRLLGSDLFKNGRTEVFPHEQSLDQEALLGRAFSASYAPREPAEAERFAAALRDVFDQYQQGGFVRLKYLTTVPLAQRRS